MNCMPLEGFSLPAPRSEESGSDLGSPKGEGGGSGDAPSGGGASGTPARGDSKYFSALKPWELELPTMGGGGGDTPPTRPLAFGCDDELPVVPGVEIVKLIAHGGQGSVYEGWMQNPGKRVAVKVPRSIDGVISARACDSLRREGELLTRMSHPKVVQVLGRGEGAVKCERMLPFLILELVEGGRPIDEYAAKQNLTARQCIELMIGVCDGVQHINDRCSIHRDLKPQNILVDRHGVAKIIDVGLAATGDVQAERREAGQAVGTRLYMAPEQVNGEPTLISGRTDVYALGMITFKVLGKRLALPIATGDTWAQVKQTILGAPALKLRELSPLPTALGDLAPSLDELSRVVDVAMRKSPASTGRSRWDSPSVLGRELRSVLETGRAGPAPGDSMETATTVAPDPGGRGTGVHDPARSGESASELEERQDGRLWQRNRTRAALGGAVAVAILMGVVFGGPIARMVDASRMFDRYAFASDEPPRNVAVIEVKSKEDITRAAEYVRAQGVEIPGFDAASPATWRPIWTHLLKTMSTCGARAVTFDIVMRPRSEKDGNGEMKSSEVISKEEKIDQEFSRMAKEHPVPVIFAVDGGIVNSVNSGTDGTRSWTTEINTNIVEWEGRHGATSAQCPSDGAWEAELGFERGSKQQIFGLSLATYAACEFPTGKPTFRSNASGSNIQLDAKIKVEDIEKSAGDTRVIGISELATIRSASPDDREAYGLEAGDSVCTLLLRMPSDAGLSSATHSLDEVLRSPSERLAWFKGRAVFIGNGVPRANWDVFEYADGRMIHGAWAHALAVEQMLQGRCVRKAGWASWVGLACLTGLVPLLILRVQGHARGDRPLIHVRRYVYGALGMVALTTLGLGAGAFLLVKLGAFSLPVAPAITSLWLSMLGIAVVVRVLASKARTEKEQST